MSDAPALGGSALSPATFGGRRRSHAKKLRLVKKKTVRRMLAKQGLKMRGGDEPTVPETPPPTGGRRRHASKRTHRRRRSLFGLKY